MPRKQAEKGIHPKQQELWALLKSVSMDPSSEGPRGVLADWLDEFFPATEVTDSKGPAWLTCAAVTAFRWRPVDDTRSWRQEYEYFGWSGRADQALQDHGLYFDHAGRTNIAGIPAFVSEIYDGYGDCLESWIKVADLVGAVAVRTNETYHAPGHAIKRYMLLPAPLPPGTDKPIYRAKNDCFCMLKHGQIPSQFLNWWAWKPICDFVAWVDGVTVFGSRSDYHLSGIDRHGRRLLPIVRSQDQLKSREWIRSTDWPVHIVEGYGHHVRQAMLEHKG